MSGILLLLSLQGISFFCFPEISSLCNSLDDDSTHSDSNVKISVRISLTILFKSAALLPTSTSSLPPSLSPSLPLSLSLSLLPHPPLTNTHTHYLGNEMSKRLKNIPTIVMVHVVSGKSEFQASKLLFTVEETLG